MNELQENIIVTDNDNYVRTLDKDTILYENGLSIRFIVGLT